MKQSRNRRSRSHSPRLATTLLLLGPSHTSVPRDRTTWSPATTPLWHSWTHTEGAGWLRLSGPPHSLFTVVSAIWKVQSKHPSLQRQLTHSKCDTGLCSPMHTFPVSVINNRADLLMPLNDDAVILYSSLCIFLFCNMSFFKSNQIQRDISFLNHVYM